MNPIKTTSLAMVLTAAKGDQNGKGDDLHWIACGNNGLNLWEFPIITPCNDNKAPALKHKQSKAEREAADKAARLATERTGATTAARALNEQLWARGNLEWHHLMPLGETWYSDRLKLEVFYMPMLWHARMLKRNDRTVFVPLDSLDGRFKVNHRTKVALNLLPGEVAVDGLFKLLDTTQMTGLQV